MGSQPAGTTHCLAAGTFRVSSTITTESGDRIIGAGETKPSSMEVRSRRPTAASSSLRAVRPSPNSISRVPARRLISRRIASVGNGTISPASCGKAFVNNSDLLTLRSVDCHDNGGNCVAGAGSLIMDDVNCWNNGGDVRRLDHKRSSSRAEQP